MSHCPYCGTEHLIREFKQDDGTTKIACAFCAIKLGWMEDPQPLPKGNGHGPAVWPAFWHCTKCINYHPLADYPNCPTS